MIRRDNVGLFRRAGRIIHGAFSSITTSTVVVAEIETPARRILAVNMESRVVAVNYENRTLPIGRG